MQFRQFTGVVSVGIAMTVFGSAAAQAPKPFVPPTQNQTAQPQQPAPTPAAPANPQPNPQNQVQPVVQQAPTNGTVVAPVQPTATPNQPGPATIKVTVPAQAKVWIGDQLTSQFGPNRTFISPPLQPGKNYAYKMKLSWPTANQQDFTVEHEITVRANQVSSIDFSELANQSPVQQASFPQSPGVQYQPTPQPQVVPPQPPRRRGFFPRFPGNQQR